MFGLQSSWLVDASPGCSWSTRSRFGEKPHKDCCRTLVWFLLKTFSSSTLCPAHLAKPVGALCIGVLKTTWPASTIRFEKTCIPSRLPDYPEAIKPGKTAVCCIFSSSHPCRPDLNHSNYSKIYHVSFVAAKKPHRFYITDSSYTHSGTLSNNFTTHCPIEDFTPYFQSSAGFSPIGLGTALPTYSHTQWATRQTASNGQGLRTAMLDSQSLLCTFRHEQDWASLASLADFDLGYPCLAQHTTWVD